MNLKKDYHLRIIKYFAHKAKSISDEKYLSIKYQLEWIKGIQDQVDWFNNPEISPDFKLNLKVAKRRLNI